MRLYGPKCWQSIEPLVVARGLMLITGNRQQLEGRIPERYGYAKDQVKREVDDWLNRA
jgi:hypothetical protein